MHYLVAYDIAHDRRRRRVAAVLEGYGNRLHESAFWLHLRPAQLSRLKARVSRSIDAREDHVVFYAVCERDRPDLLNLGRSVLPETGATATV